MFKLKVGYALAGIATGLIMLFGFIGSLPDGKLHIVFCDVGQGDGAYIRFPDGRDMVVDGGPNDKILGCLGKNMPFWDRTIDIVLMTHPQKDHMQGLIAIFDRYDVGYFIRSDVSNSTEGYQKLLEESKDVPKKFVVAGENITIGDVTLRVLGPQVTPVNNINEASVVFWLRYGSFDALFTGDATLHRPFDELALNQIEVLKVPHHGSKTGMTSAFLDWLKPQLAVISVGQNNYGHPSPEILQMLADHQARVLRTDLPAQAGTEGDIEVVSDGTKWTALTK